MEGKNELRLCHAEMIVALQLYVDHLIPAAGAKVESIKEGDNEFIIKLTKEESTLK